MMCMILVKQELVWEYITEDETQDDIVLLSVEVQTLDHNYVESLLWLTMLIFGDVSKCNAWVLGKDTAW